MPKKKSGLPEAPKESKPARKRQASGQQNLRAFFKVKSSPAEEVAVDVVDAVDGSGAEEKPSAVEESAEVVPAQPPPPSSGGLNWGASGSNSRFSSPQPDVNQFASSDGPPITELSSSSPAAIVITPSSPIATSSNDGRMSPSILSISSENFASSSKNPPPPPPSNPSTQSSVHEPIVIDDGSDDDEVVVLMPQRRDKRPVKTIHPFFARKATNPKPLDPSPPSPEKFRGRKPPSLPVEGSQHIRGSQNTFDAPALPIKRRATRPKRGHLTLLDEKLPRLTGEATSLSFEDQPTDFRLRACNDLDEDDIERYLGYVPAKHLNLPAFKRFDDHLQSPDPPQPSSETWADKWRPRAAEQVLFNELNALYLKAWLQTLSLQLESRDSKSAQGLRSDPRGDGQMARGSKRPAVIRSVHRQKGRKRLKRNPYDEEDDEDDWIVDDDEVEDSWIGEGDDVDEFIFSRPVPPSDLPESTPVDDRPPDEPSGPQSLPTQPQFVPGQSHLTNTILLSGPSGSGKTAAVYACAEELGWEVFEVYPGIGKRSGANLSSLVGDVAKNHLVNNRGPSGTSNSISTLLGTSDKRTEKSRADANPSGSVRQSIILLEEVDILFNEDINFWPSVVKLIADSRRPVIMTCNDPNLVPVTDLPLQEMLQFQPCSESLANSYIKCLALAEGHLIDASDVHSLCKNSTWAFTADVPEIPHPTPSEAVAAFDLRKAINQAQLWCVDGSTVNAILQSCKEWKRGDECTSSMVEKAADWTEDHATAPERSVISDRNEARSMVALTRFIDNVSFSDAQVLHLSFRTLQAHWQGEPLGEREETMGHVGLANGSNDSASLAFYDRDGEMLSTIVEGGRAWYEKTGAGRRSRSGSVESKTPGPATRWTGKRFDSVSLFRVRSNYQSELVTIVDKIYQGIPLNGRNGQWLPRSEMHLDYLPCLRTMVDVDDVLAAAMGGERRRTRSGRGGGYERYLWLDDDEQRVLRARFG